MYGTSDHEGSTGLFVQIMTYKFGTRIEDVEDRPNEFLELVRRYDEANGTDPVPDQVKKACIISNTPEPLKTHLQLNVSKLGTFDALRVATEDYLWNRRIFKTTSAGNTHEHDPMEVDLLSRKGEGKEKSGKGKKGGKKGKESPREVSPRIESGTHTHLMVSVEILDNTVTKLLIVGTSSNTSLKPKVKVRASRNPTSQKSVYATRANKQKRRGHQILLHSQTSSLSQVNAIGEIGLADDGLWIFSVEDSKKRRYSVNWKDGTHSRESETCERGEEHELMIDSGCYGHVCPPWFAPQFPLVSSSSVEAVAANDETLRHYGQKVVYGHVTTNSGRRILIQITFDVMSVRKSLLSTSALKRRGVTIIFNHDYDRIIFRNETVNLISHDCHSYLCLTLAKGIPHRKAVVVAGENVSNDVDEEVYVGDGVMGEEAQGASAGDRRAITDADQARQLDISGETRAARALRTSEPPQTLQG